MYFFSILFILLSVVPVNDDDKDILILIHKLKKEAFLWGKKDNVINPQIISRRKNIIAIF